MPSLAETLFQPISQDISFYVAPDEAAVAAGNELILAEQLPIRHPVSAVYQYLDMFPDLDLAKIDEDPVIQAARNLSPALLFSMLRLSAVDDLAAYILRDNNGLPDLLREKVESMAENIDYVSGQFETGNPERMAKSLAYFPRHGRNILFNLVAPELLANEGLELHRDFLSPLKLVEMGIGYDPHIATIQSRAAGLQIPYQIRRLEGSLRFAQQARAQDSMVSVLVQEFQHLHLAHAHFFNMIRTQLETTLGVPISMEKSRFVCDDEISSDALTEFAHTDPVFTLMRNIAKTEFVHLGNTFSDDAPDKMEIGEVDSLKDMSTLAFDTAVMMVDPSVSNTLTAFPEIEVSGAEEFTVPKGFLYHFNQNYLLLRPRSTHLPR